MALESFGTILYVAEISYQSDNWYGNCQGGPKLYTDTHTYRHTHTHTHTDTHTRRKCRNKTKKVNTKRYRLPYIQFY